MGRCTTISPVWVQMSLNYGGGDSNWIGNQGDHEGGGTYIANILSLGHIQV